jgi:prepilin-type N-terminal cleavage/methylation domain-containing protein
MKRQAGMTLVEMILAITITGVIVVALGTAIYQILTISAYGNDEFTALHEMQHAAYWFNKDGQEAKAATGGSQLALTLSDNTTVTYSLAGTDLIRNANGQQITLARNITSVTFLVNGQLLTMYITATPSGGSGVSENGTYMVHLRSEEQ